MSRDTAALKKNPKAFRDPKAPFEKKEKNRYYLELAKLHNKSAEFDIFIDKCDGFCSYEEQPFGNLFKALALGPRPAALEPKKYAILINLLDVLGDRFFRVDFPPKFCHGRSPSLMKANWQGNNGDKILMTQAGFFKIVLEISERLGYLKEVGFNFEREIEFLNSIIKVAAPTQFVSETKVEAKTEAEVETEADDIDDITEDNASTDVSGSQVQSLKTQVIQPQTLAMVQAPSLTKKRSPNAKKSLKEPPQLAVIPLAEICSQMPAEIVVQKAEFHNGTLILSEKIYCDPDIFEELEKNTDKEYQLIDFLVMNGKEFSPVHLLFRRNGSNIDFSQCLCAELNGRKLYLDIKHYMFFIDSVDQQYTVKKTLRKHEGRFYEVLVFTPL